MARGGRARVPEVRFKPEEAALLPGVLPRKTRTTVGSRLARGKTLLAKRARQVLAETLVDVPQAGQSKTARRRLEHYVRAPVFFAKRETN